jgi:hypothetical protein
MAGDRTSKAHTTLSWGFELLLGIKSGMNNNKQIEIIVEYLQDKTPNSCFDPNNCMTATAFTTEEA